jgi:alkylation response protein AidB-like acyl-CoA dehydrogenase
MHHCQYVMVVDHGTPEQRETFLPPIARGESLVASATTEPETGGNANFCVSAKDVDGDRITLSATKPVVTSANYADWVYCTTRSSSDAPGDELSMVIMPGPASDESVERFGRWDCIGMRATASTGLRFKDTSVPLSHQVGPEDSAQVRSSSMTIASRAGFAATWQGIATSAFEATLEHVQNKTHTFIRTDPSGSTREEHRTVAEAETTQRQLAEMRVKLLASRELLHAAARRIDERRDELLEGGPAEDVHDLLWSARIACGQSAIDVTRQGLRLCGVTGLRAGNLTLERHMRDALTAQVMAPSEDATKLILGQQLASSG